MTPVTEYTTDPPWATDYPDVQPPRGLHVRQTGRLPDVVTRYGAWGDRQILIGGGPQMIEATKAALIAKGARKNESSTIPWLFDLERARRQLVPVDNPTMADLETVTLKDPSSSLTATYVPGAGMIGTSLSDDGVELLGQRRGLHAYMTTGKTMGIPILYPWANRLSANTYGVDGAVVTLTPGIGGVRTDHMAWRSTVSLPRTTAGWSPRRPGNG